MRRTRVNAGATASVLRPAAPGSRVAHRPITRPRARFSIASIPTCPAPASPTARRTDRARVDGPESGAEREADRAAHALLQGRHVALSEIAPTGTEPTGELRTELAGRGGRGAPLPASMRNTLESGLATDLSGVRVHSDERADSIARSLGARALAHGDDVYFRRGAFDAASARGQERIAHEVVHVVQQRSSRRALQLQEDEDDLASQALRILDPEQPELETEWDAERPREPAIGPQDLERSTPEDAPARAAESAFALRQIGSILASIEDVGAAVDVFLFTANGAITMVSWRRSEEGTSSRGAALSVSTIAASLSGFLPTFLGTSARYVRLTFTRETARWQLSRFAVEAPTDSPPVPAEARALPADVSGYGERTFGGVVGVTRDIFAILAAPRNGSAEVRCRLVLEDDRVVRWELESIERTGGDRGATVPAAPAFRDELVNALLPFTTGVESRTVRITLHGSHRGRRAASDWRVEEAGVVRPASSGSGVPDPVLEYRRRHQEIIRRWREGTRDVAVYMAMIGAREIALWIATGIVFRALGLAFRTVAPRLFSILGRGAAAARTAWLETLVTRLAPAERQTLARIMTKVETEGVEALTVAERAELERLLRLLDDMIERPLTTAEKGYLRTAMVGRYEAARPAVVAAFRGAGRAYQIHHRMPLEYAHLVPATDINAASNLIALDTTVHRGVNAVWTRFRTAPASQITAPRVEAVARIVDRHFGHWYQHVPPASGLQTAVDAARDAARAEVDVILAAL